MPAALERGFFVREPAWHQLGVVLHDFPGREKAMELAGHNFSIVEKPFMIKGNQIPMDEFLSETFDRPYMTDADGDVYFNEGPGFGWKTFIKSMPGDPTDGKLVHVGKDSFTTIQNDVGWDVVDAIVGQGAKYESAGTLDDGAKCWVLAWLDEPVRIKGDNSDVLPFICTSWAHDGSGSLRARSTSWRVVCANTERASQNEAERNKTEFVFRHTAHVMDRIEEAKEALQGLRKEVNLWAEQANELAKVRYTKTRREIFVQRFIPMPKIDPAAITAVVSERKVENIETARTALRNIFDGETIPDAHKLTAYGMHLAGIEFLDWVRGTNRSPESRFTDSMLKNSPEKAKLRGLVMECARA